NSFSKGFDAMPFHSFADHSCICEFAFRPYAHAELCVRSKPPVKRYFPIIVRRYVRWRQIYRQLGNKPNCMAFRCRGDRRSAISVPTYFPAFFTQTSNACGDKRAPIRSILPTVSIGRRYQRRDNPSGLAVEAGGCTVKKGS